MNARILQRMRSVLNTFLTDTCTIEQEVREIGAMGEEVHVWQVVARNVPCRVITTGGSISNDMREVGSQEAMVTQYRLAVPYSQSLTVNQRATVGTAVYQITSVLEKRTDSTDTQAVIVRVENG